MTALANQMKTAMVLDIPLVKLTPDASHTLFPPLITQSVYMILLLLV